MLDVGRTRLGQEQPDTDEAGERATEDKPENSLTARLFVFGVRRGLLRPIGPTTAHVHAMNVSARKSHPISNENHVNPTKQTRRSLRARQQSRPGRGGRDSARTAVAVRWCRPLRKVTPSGK